MRTALLSAAVLVFGIGSITGCAARGGSSDIPPGALPSATVAPGDRRIGADDLLTITVLDAPELTRSVRVSSSGEISMPLIGAVPATGKSTQELETAIADKLRGKYMVDPQVSVEMKETRARSIYVLGAVNQPGAFPIQGAETLTVLRAVTLGEGLKGTAAKGNAKIIRTNAAGQRQEIPVDLGGVLAGTQADVPLQENDVLYVPTSSGKSIASGVLNALVRVVTLRGVF